jgi:hypothetical protein
MNITSQSECTEIVALNGSAVNLFDECRSNSARKIDQRVGMRWPIGLAENRRVVYRPLRMK